MAHSIRIELAFNFAHQTHVDTMTQITWSKSNSMFVAGLMMGLVSASALFAVLGSRGNTEGSAKVLRLAHGLDPNHPVHQGMVHLADRLAEISGGQMRIDIYPSGQLGSETESLEKLQSGTLAMTKTSSATLGSFVERMQAFSLPYIFRDHDHYWRVLDGTIGQELLTGLVQRDDGQASGLMGVCFFDAGSRNYYARDRQVTAPDDLQGLKMRVMNDPMAIRMVDAMGGSATPIPWGELYTSLQQGVVDGAENNPPSFVSSAHYEVCKYFSFNEHTRIPDVLVISAVVWDRLSPQQQQWLTQAANEASVYQRGLWRRSSDEALAFMVEHGVDVVYPDQTPFREAAAPLLESYADTPAGQLARRIIEHE